MPPLHVSRPPRLLRGFCFCLALCLCLAVPWLTGCDGCSDKQIENAAQKVDQAAADVQRGLNANNRAAIEQVGRELTTAMNNLPDISQKDPVTARTAVDAFYNQVVAIDISACPDDFRARYRSYLATVRDFDNFLEEAPLTDDELSQYMAQQPDSTNQDEVLDRLERQFKQKYEQVMDQTNELAAIAHKYGANWDAGSDATK